MAVNEDEHGNLEAPPKESMSMSMEDPGAHDLESSDSDDHFSDAHSGLEPTTGDNSPVPITRVEKVDDEPSHGEVPGTDAYHMREQDAAPDEIAVIPEGTESRPRSATSSRTSTPGRQPVPITVVEKVNPEEPSHGDVPGTLAHDIRAADAVPDVVVKAGSHSRSQSSADSLPGDLPVPVTKVEKVDSTPSHGEVPGTKAFELRKEDAEPDFVEEVGDAAGSPTMSGARSQPISHARQRSSLGGKKVPIPVAVTDEYNEEEDGSDGGFGDDFDDFEEGEEDAEFGDFDEGFQEAAAPPLQQQSLPPTPSFPVLDFATLTTASEIHTATEPYLNTLFPPDTIDTSILPPLPTNTSANPIFLTPRSASLWSQLVAPPPLQPPNWIRSRIRRLFLVSLGVPIDLDEILPATSQKKLILPSLSLSATRTSSTFPRLKEAASSTTSLDSQNQPSSSSKRSDSRRRKGPPPPPTLDLVSARQLCSVTDEALGGMTEQELRAHVERLQGMEGMAKEVLEYWMKRTDEKLGDREAFEGVIENLVKHARKVRK